MPFSFCDSCEYQEVCAHIHSCSMHKYFKQEVANSGGVNTFGDVAGFGGLAPNNEHLNNNAGNDQVIGDKD